MLAKWPIAQQHIPAYDDSYICRTAHRVDACTFMFIYTVLCVHIALLLVLNVCMQVKQRRNLRLERVRNLEIQYLQAAGRVSIL